MKRRSFLALPLAAMGLVAFSKLPRLDSVIPGIVANDLPSVRLVSPRWMYVAFGEWCWDTSKTYACGWTIHCYERIPTVAEVLLCKTHSSYLGEWMLAHNEPYLNQITPQAYADLAVQQMQVILHGDPNAVFGVEIGDGDHAPYDVNSWYSQMWDSIPKPLKANITFYYVHKYQGGLTINQFLANMQAWMLVHPNRKLILSEVGKTLGTNPAGYDPLAIQKQCNKHGLWRFAYYPLIGDVPPASLYEPLVNAGQLTETGNAFVSL